MSGTLKRLEPLAKKAVDCSACFEDDKLQRSFVDLPQPRYIGAGYWSSSNKVAFVMLNPGAGQHDWRNADWKQHIERFQSDHESLEDLFLAQRRHMPHWSSGKLMRFIEQHGLQVDDLALVNIAWCATESNKYPNCMLNKCYRLHTSEWIEVLDPNTIILSGTASHKFEEEMATLIPHACVLTTYHYAHRPSHAAKAKARAKEIADILTDKASG